MPRRKFLPVETWFEAFHCWTDPGECNEDWPMSDSLGIFPTREEAEEAGKKKGLKKILTEKEHASFESRSGPNGCYIKEYLVVFTDKSRTKARVVSDKTIELTSAIDERRQKFLDKAEKAGIPAKAIRLDAVGLA